MIDVKELRIGSHVLMKGIRAEVVSIKDITTQPEYSIQQIEVVASPYGTKKTVVVMSRSDEIKPIPITPELLEELGFAQMSRHGDISVWLKYSVKVDIIGNRVVVVSMDAKNHASISIHYLHELEWFVYLTTKQELIKE